MATTTSSSVRKPFNMRIMGTIGVVVTWYPGTSQRNAIMMIMMVRVDDTARSFGWYEMIWQGHSGDRNQDYRNWSPHG